MNSSNDRLNSALTNTSSRRQALKLMGGGLVGGLAMATGIKGAVAQPEPTGGPGRLPVDLAGNVLYGGTEGVTDFFEITRFSNKGGQLTASGNYYEGGAFVDTFTSAVGTILVDPELEDSGVGRSKLASVATGRTSDVSLAQDAECQILFLELGPLNLDVLGLVIEIPNPIVLDIYAVPGAGNLLGNLLCAVAGLLDGGSPLSRIIGLLNRILGNLGF